MGLVTEHGLSEGNTECPKRVRGSDEGFPEMMIGLHDDTFIIMGFRRAWRAVEHFFFNTYTCPIARHEGTWDNGGKATLILDVCPRCKRVVVTSPTVHTA
jgi:hypothetical protein